MDGNAWSSILEGMGSISKEDKLLTRYLKAKSWIMGQQTSKDNLKGSFFSKGLLQKSIMLFPQGRFYHSFKEETLFRDYQESVLQITSGLVNQINFDLPSSYLKLISIIQKLHPESFKDPRLIHRYLQPTYLLLSYTLQDEPKNKSRTISTPGRRFYIYNFRNAHQKTC